MANGDRTKRILANVQRALGSHGDTEASSPAAIFDTIERVQRRICEDTYCLEKSDTITTSLNTELYDFPSDFIDERMLIPSSTSIPMKFINMNEVDRIKRDGVSSESVSDSLADNIYYYYKWNGQFGFLLSDGSAPGADLEVTVYYYSYPDRVSDKPSLTRDPVVNERWDTALFYGSVAELSSDANWYQKFEIEFQRQRRRESVSRVTPAQIVQDGEYD